MTSGRYPGRRVRRGRPGLPGDGSIPAGWVVDIENRVADLETGISLSTADLTDVGDISSIDDNQFLRWDSSTNQFLPYDMPSLTLDFDMPFIFDGMGSAIPARTWYSGIQVSFDFEIRGWSMASPGGGTVIAPVNRTNYVSYPTDIGISGTGDQRPHLYTGTLLESWDMTGWVPAVIARDLIRIETIAGATSVFATLTLHCRRTINLV